MLQSQLGSSPASLSKDVGSEICTVMWLFPPLIPIWKSWGFFFLLTKARESLSNCVLLLAVHTSHFWEVVSGARLPCPSSWPPVCGVTGCAAFQLSLQGGGDKTCLLRPPARIDEIVCWGFLEQCLILCKFFGKRQLYSRRICGSNITKLYTWEF